ncbi:MAG: 50S ribosomal protein L2, partial [Bdellovibrionota bacterium]
MSIKKYSPTTPCRRYMTTIASSEFTKGVEIPKRLITAKKSKFARNHFGRITTRHQGGGHKQLYRVIDFKRNKLNISAKVDAICYD